MDILGELTKPDNDLTFLQISIRATITFFICLLLIRLSGRRTLSVKMPFDFIIPVILGAVLSKGMVGSTAFLQSILASVIMVALHRLLGWAGLYVNVIDRLLKGRKILLYDKGKIIHRALQRCIMTKEDLIEQVRINSNMDDLEQVERIYAETDGSISVVKKKYPPEP